MKYGFSRRKYSGKCYGDERFEEDLSVYLATVACHLQNSFESRRLYMTLLRQEIRAYIKAHPGTTIVDIHRQFGDPYKKRSCVMQEQTFRYIKKMERGNIIYTFVDLAMLIVVILLLIQLFPYFRASL